VPGRSLTMTDRGPSRRDGDPAWHDVVDAHRRDLDLGDLTVHVVDLGEGPPVVMVHGWGDSTYTWHRNVAALTEAGLRTVLVDQPGMGRSSAPPPPDAFRLEGQARHVLAAADRLGLERFGLVGHSMGGAIVLELCRAQPDRVERAAVVAPVCHHPRRPAMARPGLHRVARLLPRRLLVHLTLRKLFVDRTQVDRRMVEEYAHAAARPDYDLNLALLARRFFSPAFDRMVDSYPSIRTPIMVIWGERDPWLSLRRGRALAETLPSSVLHVIPATGHMPHMERPDLVNPLLVEHLAEPGRRAATPTRLGDGSAD
jgi:pimeloyl-ACP methyl ester carboxylesterase